MRCWRPAFVDSHVHTVRTGFALTGLDLTGSPSLAAALDELAAFAGKHPEHGVLVGQGWDETGWPEHRPPTGDELERAAPARRTYLTRVDGHSSVVSPGPGRARARAWPTSTAGPPTGGSSATPTTPSAPSSRA